MEGHLRLRWGGVERKVEAYGKVGGIVFKAFGEASAKLIQIMGVGKLKGGRLETGMEHEKAEVGVVVG